jgi:hypothetical protein
MSSDKNNQNYSKGSYLLIELKLKGLNFLKLDKQRSNSAPYRDLTYHQGGRNSFDLNNKEGCKKKNSEVFFRKIRETLTLTQGIVVTFM